MTRNLTILLLFLLVQPLTGVGQQARGFESLVAAAQKAQAAKDYATAASDYKQAVKIRPEIAELWANLGLMQQDSADLAGAIASFQQANRINPSLYVPNLFLGIDYIRTGKQKEAIPLLIKAEKTNQTDPQAPLALGRAYIRDAKFNSAAGELIRATALDPKLGTAWFTLGIAYLDQVEIDARTLSTEAKESTFAGALFAESLQKQGRFGEAASLLKSLLDTNPQPPCLRSELGFALLREHEPAAAVGEFAAERSAHPQCGLALLGQARMALDSGDNAQATALLNELWNRDRGFVESNAAILLEGMDSGKASSSAAFLVRQTGSADLAHALSSAFGIAEEPAGDASGPDVSQAAPASGPLHSADESYASGRFEDCALRLEPEFGSLTGGHLRLLAACAFFTGNNQLASRAAARLRSLEPHSFEALYWSIQANERLAFRALARFQQLEPDSARSHVLLGDIYQQLERHDDAQAEYQRALALAPGDPAAMLGLASAYLSNNKNDGAIAIAQAALVRTPADPELNLIVGEAMLAKNDYTGAEPYLIKALQSKPQIVPRVHALIGKAYAETGRTEEAIQQLNLGSSADEDGAIDYLLARLYRKVGDTKAATQALERMKILKQQHRDRGIKRVEDPDLSSLEFSSSGSSTP